ncbi:MAG: glycosyltransferase family 2 protein [Planctomycetes bacterium]|nr:glycosyltransferase family 2 protein [Planctomycetota bacterium]
MTTDKKLISIIVPAYNEEDCVAELARRLALVFDANPKYDFEAIIIENGSVDNTWTLLQAIHSNDPRFKIIQLARNFRMDGGLTAGLHYASGDAAVLMTADLQDPPELITDFIRKWEEGYENVYMIVTKRRGTGPIRRFNSRAFYWLAGKLTDDRIPANASDFRLVDRRVYETVRSMEERNRFIRGLFAWVGFHSVGIEAERPERFGGVSNAHSLKVIDLAFKGIFSHSYVPLKLITVTGLFLSIASLITTVVLSFVWIAVGVPFAGFGSIISLGLMLFGVLAFMIGLVAEYVGLIYEEVKARPNFVVRTTLGLDQ